MRYQSTFSDVEYLNRKRISKREEFLDSMNEIVPWDRWIGLIKPFYPNGKRGRPTRGIETMLRMYLLQIWFNLSDEGIEDAIYDSIYGTIIVLWTSPIRLLPESSCFTSSYFLSLYEKASSLYKMKSVFQ